MFGRETEVPPAPYVIHKKSIYIIQWHNEYKFRRHIRIFTFNNEDEATSPQPQLAVSVSSSNSIEERAMSNKR